VVALFGSYYESDRRLTCERNLGKDCGADIMYVFMYDCSCETSKCGAEKECHARFEKSSKVGLLGCSSEAKHVTRMLGSGWQLAAESQLSVVPCVSNAVPHGT
jgi:hypothetical protein